MTKHTPSKQKAVVKGLRKQLKAAMKIVAELDKLIGMAVVHEEEEEEEIGMNVSQIAVSIGMKVKNATKWVIHWKIKQFVREHSWIKITPDLRFGDAIPCEDGECRYFRQKVPLDAYECSYQLMNGSKVLYTMCDECYRSFVLGSSFLVFEDNFIKQIVDAVMKNNTIFQ